MYARAKDINFSSAKKLKEKLDQKFEDLQQPQASNHIVACVAGGSGYPRELRSRTRVQKAAQVARRMGRSLVGISLAATPLAKIQSRAKPARELAASPQNVSRSDPLPPATQANHIVR